MAQQMWYQHSGEQGDVVISTRIRLARNLAHLPFPSQMSAEQREDVIKQVFGAFPDDQPCAFERRRMKDIIMIKQAYILSGRQLITLIGIS